MDGEILGSEPPFLLILGSSNDFSGATGLVSCGTNLGGLASVSVNGP